MLKWTQVSLVPAMRFDIFMAVKIRVEIFWVVTLMMEEA